MAKPKFKIKHTITKKEWDKTHKDFKSIIDGVHYVMKLTDKGTALVPVNIDESINEVEMGDVGFVKKHDSIATVYGVMSGGKKVKVKLGKTGKIVVIDTKDIQILPESVDENFAVHMAVAKGIQNAKLKNPETKKVVKATTALKDKNHPAHKQAKSLLQRLKDKFSKKEDIEEGLVSPKKGHEFFQLTKDTPIEYITRSYTTMPGQSGVLWKHDTAYIDGKKGAYLIDYFGAVFYVDLKKKFASPIYPMKDQKYLKWNTNFTDIDKAPEMSDWKKYLKESITESQGIGKLAFAQGKDVDDNPFKPGTKQHVDWLKGFNFAQSRKLKKGESVNEGKKLKQVKKDKYGNHLEPQFKKGDLVTYLGHPAIITGVNKESSGVYSYNVDYNKGNGRTKARNIFNKSGDELKESINEADVKKKVNRRGDVDGLLVKHNGEEYEIVYSGDFDMGGAVQPYGIVMPGDDVVSFLGKDKKAKSIWKQLKPKVDKFLKSNESVNEEQINEWKLQLDLGKVNPSEFENWASDSLQKKHKIKVSGSGRNWTIVGKGNDDRMGSSADWISQLLGKAWKVNKIKVVQKESINEAKEPEVISQLRSIVKDQQNKKIKDPISGKMMRVDFFSASAVTKVYDALNKSNKDKFGKLSLPKMVNVAFKFVK